MPVNDRYYVRISSIASIFYATSPTPSSVAPPDLFDSAYSDVGRVRESYNKYKSMLFQFEERQHILYHNVRSRCDAFLLSGSLHINLGFLC